MSWAILFPLIFAASLVLSMVGLGGGLIFSPLFVLLHFQVDTAVSASLFLNGTAAVSAAIIYLRKGMVDVRIALPLMITSTLSAPFGAMLTSRIDLQVFVGILSVVIFLAAMRMLFSVKTDTGGASISHTCRIIGGGSIGVVIGVMAGLLGIGGGVFLVPLLIYILGVPTKTAAATSIFVVVFSSFSGFIAHISLTDTDWKFILLASIFSFCGAQLGSRFMSEKLKGQTVRRIFAAVLLVFVFNLVQKFF